MIEDYKVIVDDIISSNLKMRDNYVKKYDQFYLDFLNFINDNNLIDFPFKERLFYFYSNNKIIKKCKCGNNLKTWVIGGIRKHICI